MLSKNIHQQAFINQSGSPFPQYLQRMIEHRIGMQVLQMVFYCVGLNELVCSFSQISLALLLKVQLKNIVSGDWFRTGKQQLLEPMLTNMYDAMSLRWRHNKPDSVSNHQPLHCLLNRLFRCRSKKTSKPRVTGLCVGNSPGTGEFPAQMVSNAENVSIWWRHHVVSLRYNGLLWGECSHWLCMDYRWAHVYSTRKNNLK